MHNDLIDVVVLGAVSVHCIIRCWDCRILEFPRWAGQWVDSALRHRSAFDFGQWIHAKKLYER